MDALALGMDMPLDADSSEHDVEGTLAEMIRHHSGGRIKGTKDLLRRYLSSNRPSASHGTTRKSSGVIYCRLVQSLHLGSGGFSFGRRGVRVRLRFEGQTVRSKTAQRGSARRGPAWQGGEPHTALPCTPGDVVWGSDGGEEEHIFLVDEYIARGLCIFGEVARG